MADAEEEDLEFIGKFFSVRNINAGETLLKQGSVFDGLAIVAKGKLDGHPHMFANSSNRPHGDNAVRCHPDPPPTHTHTHTHTRPYSVS